MAKARYSKNSSGVYHTRLSTGKRDDNGKLITIDIYSSLSSADLERKVAEAKYMLRIGEYVAPSNITFQIYSDKWFSTYTQGLEDKTIEFYRGLLRKINKDIGSIRLQQLTESDLMMMVNNHSDHYRTVKGMLQLVRRIIKQAIKDKIIRDDISDDIRIKKPIKKESRRTLYDYEKDAIKAADFSPMQKAYIYILYYTGMRKEEVLALMPNDFNFKKKMVSVNRALQVGKSRQYTKIKSTKNSSSLRDIPLPDAVIPFLKSYIENIDTMYLFTSPSGELMTQTQFRRFWDEILLELNKAAMPAKQIQLIHKLPREARKANYKINSLTSYIFRHNYATMLYYSNISLKQAVKIMGHTDEKMLMQIYAHLDEQRENLTEKINNNIAL